MFYPTFRKIINPLLKCINVITKPFGNSFADDFKPVKPNDVKLVIASMSDLHLTEAKWRSRKFRNGLVDIENAKYPADLFVNLGDTADHGELNQFKLAENIMTKYCTRKNIVVLGNHDTWTTIDPVNPESHVYDIAIVNFKNYRKNVSGVDEEKSYYSCEVNGYKFIVLGSEDTSVRGTVSDEQIEWLKSELDRCDTSKPTFILYHNVLKKTHGLYEMFAKKFDVSKHPEFNEPDKVRETIEQYKNIVYICGHTHMGLCDKDNHSSVDVQDKFVSVNLPSYTHFVNHAGIPFSGLGFVFEIYDKEIIIRARSFASGIWYSKYVYKVTLKED